MTLCLRHIAAVRRRQPSEDALGRWHQRKRTCHGRCNKSAGSTNLEGRHAWPDRSVTQMLLRLLSRKLAVRFTCGILDESKSVESTWGMGSLDSATITTATGWHTLQRLVPLHDRMTASRASAIHGILRGCRLSFTSSASSRLQRDKRKWSDACRRVN